MRAQPVTTATGPHHTPERLPHMPERSTPRTLAGRTAVVTGASSGIGAATAEHLAGLGARVVVIARRVERLTDVVERIEKNGARRWRSRPT